MAVSISQVAAKAKVSNMTVSRVLQSKGSVSEKTRQRVMAVIEELGYVPSNAARALRSKDSLRASASSCFALVFGADTQMADEFFCDVARGAEREAVLHGLCPLQVHWQEDFENSWPRMQAMFATEGLCGAILAGQFAENEIELIKQHSQNVVTVDSPAPLNSEVAAVESDNLGGARLALGHLQQRGCKRVLLLTGPREHYFGGAMAQAAQGVRSAFETLRILHGDYTADWAMRTVLERWRDGDEFDGIFTNDHMAFGVTRALKELGVEVPGRVKLMGFDNVDYGKFLAPSLSTIDIDKGKLGSEAVKSLVQMIRGETNGTEFKKVIPAHLVIREST
ncbi:MAG: LacI family DNA-binding transcriptional regulator [Sedimentisphaerales bacterium]|nr:LacI family DNA-binding transcriptional regulator [Sedimentisphaerales bacterium]